MSKIQRTNGMLYRAERDALPPEQQDKFSMLVLYMALAMVDEITATNIIARAKETLLSHSEKDEIC